MSKNEIRKRYVLFIVSLFFQLGLRVGELSALKWEDIDFIEKRIHIHRMETNCETSNNKLKRTIVNYTTCKSEYGDRILPLSDYAIELFNKIKFFNDEHYSKNDFIFINDNDKQTI